MSCAEGLAPEVAPGGRGHKAGLRRLGVEHSHALLHLTCAIRKEVMGVADEQVVQLGGVARKAMADQVRTVAKQRIGDRIGELSADDMRAVEKALRTQLKL